MLLLWKAWKNFQVGHPKKIINGKNVTEHKNICYVINITSKEKIYLIYF